MKVVHILLAFAAALLLDYPETRAQDSVDNVARKLVDEGFVNVRCLDLGSSRVYSLQNDRYKLQSEGLAKALDIIRKSAPGDSAQVKIIATDYDIPQVSLTYNPGTGRCETSYVLGNYWKQIRRQEKLNSSFGKVDVVVYPQVSLMNLIITQVYQSLWQLSPAVEVSLWPGSKISAQVKIPLINDGYGYREDKVHPGMITLSQRFRDPWNARIFGKATVGFFSSDARGVALELFHPFHNERFSVEAGAAYIGTGFWDGFTYHFYKGGMFSWSASANYYWPLASTQFTARVQRFLNRDTGVKLEAIRHFSHCSIGFYLQKGFGAGMHTNGGFRFQITLPPYRMRRNGYFPRITTSGQMGISYNANNERVYYREFRTEASDNIMQHNGFNPYFIDKEINRLNY